MANKDRVFETYDIIADWYDEHRSRDLFEKSYLDLAISKLKPKATVLDIGCGMGEPIARYFVDQGFQLTGIDGSEKLLSMAEQNLPSSKFILADMRQLDLNETFDCLIAWDSFFHLSQDDQHAMFPIFEKHINSDGILIFTAGPDAGEVWSDNGGEDLYHASLSVDEYKALLAKHHFEVITSKINDEECRGHSVWVARYTSI